MIQTAKYRNRDGNIIEFRQMQDDNIEMSGHFSTTCTIRTNLQNVILSYDPPGGPLLALNMPLSFIKQEWKDRVITELAIKGTKVIIAYAKVVNP